MINNEAMELIPLLWKGGEWGNYFTLPKQVTHWRMVSNTDHMPTNDSHIYFGVHPADKKKSTGRIGVADVACINCLFADFDWKDFGGEDATIAQINRSTFKPSIIISSGGGFHVYWLLKDTFYLQTDADREHAKDIQKKWVELLDADPGAKDLAHILRPPGTKNNKYDPLRVVEFYEFNPDIRYDLELLEAILPEAPPREPKSHNQSTPDSEKVQDALSRLAPWRYDEYYSWIKTGMALQELGDDGLALWDSWSQGSAKYVSGDCAKRWETFKGQGVTLGSIFYWANHDNPRPKNKPQPKTEVQQPEPPPEIEEEPGGEKLASPRTIWTVADLLNAEFPEPRWAIPGIIPEGLSIFGGRPKVGKSWLMLQASWSVGSGGRFFDQEVERGDVLYFALEDGPRRLQDRIKTMGIGSDALITFQTRLPPLHQNGLNDLLVELERTDYRMVVIDTLTRSIPGVDQKKSDGVVGRIFDDLQRLAMNRNIAIVLVDHTRKPSGYAADPVDDILHITAKTAIADSILALYKEQGKAGAKLLGRGRDIEDVEYSIHFDPATRAWQIDTPDLTENFDDILGVLEVLGKVQLADIAKATGQNRGNLYKRLMRLVEIEMVEREKVGRNVYYEKSRSK